MIAALLMSCAARAPTGTAPPFAWPTPPDWRGETIPFPLDFAKDLPYRGVEELRFAPDFFDATAPTYFSYVFVWWLEGEPELGEQMLERDLVAYFAGLSDAVGGKKFTFDPAHYRATLAPREGGGFEGVVETYDPFGAGQELTLYVELTVRDCPAAERRSLLALASPRARPDPVWDGLDAVGAGFECP
jgi:hypothetical protein